MPLYPILDAYPTVQGEGIVQSGRPIFLVRFGTSKAWQYAHLNTTRPAVYQNMTQEELVLRAESFQPRMVHFTGDEPCLTDIVSLGEAFLREGFDLSMDTCGAYYLPPDFLNKLTHLSVGPKPGLHTIRDVYNTANELRYYLNYQDEEFRTYLEYMMPDRERTLVIPYTLEREDINYALAWCIQNDYRLHIPTYRAVPTFDADQNGGAVCNICLLQDQQVERQHLKDQEAFDFATGGAQ